MMNWKELKESGCDLF